MNYLKVSLFVLVIIPIVLVFPETVIIQTSEFSPYLILSESTNYLFA